MQKRLITKLQCGHAARRTLKSAMTANHNLDQTIVNLGRIISQICLEVEHKFLVGHPIDMALCHQPSLSNYKCTCGISLALIKALRFEKAIASPMFVSLIADALSTNFSAAARFPTVSNVRVAFLECGERGIIWF